MTDQKPLAKGTLTCPACKTALHFEHVGGIRVVRYGMLSARCPTCRVYLTVVPNEKHG